METRPDSPSSYHFKAFNVSVESQLPPKGARSANQNGASRHYIDASGTIMTLTPLALTRNAFHSCKILSNVA
jgi:hypothetical protein